MDNNLNYKLWLDKLYSVDVAVEILDLIIDEKISIKDAIKKVSRETKLDEKSIVSLLPEILVA
ncbi:MAG: hypothetical protein ACRC7N_15240 [Clostridium sp.]